MGLVQQNQSIDDSYSAEIIAKARSLSAEIEEYVVTQQYLTEVDDPDVVDPMWLRNRLTVMITEQLEGRGIRIQAGKPQICNDPALVHLVMTLRSKFDTDKLYDFLRDREELRDELTELANDDADCIEAIVLACNRACPLDEGWEYIGRYLEDHPGQVVSSSEFVDELQSVFEKIDRLGPPDPVTEDYAEAVAKFVKYLGDRKRTIEDIAVTMYGTVVRSAPATESMADVSDYRKQAISGIMVDFEKELGRSKYVIACATSSDQAKTLNEIRGKFTPNWTHCLEYWIRPEIAQSKSPTELDVDLMTATLFVDAGVNNSSAKVLVIDAVEKVKDMIGKNYEFIRDAVDNALANIVVKQEGGLTNVA